MGSGSFPPHLPGDLTVKDKRLLITTLTNLLLLLAASFSPAYAHAAISPRTSSQGKTEVYQLVVFGERTPPTVEVELVVPDGVEVQGVEPTAGWTHTFVRNSSGSISKIEWKGSLPLGGQVELRFVARNVGREGLYSFKALQKYADDEIAEWDYAGMRVDVKAPSTAIAPVTIGYIVTGLVATVAVGLILLKKRAKRRS